LGPPLYLKLQIWQTDWPLGVVTKKCKTRSKGVVKGLHDLLLEFWDPLYISGTIEAGNLKFGMKIGHGGPKRNNAKLGQKVS